MIDRQTITAYDRNVDAYAQQDAGHAPHPTLLRFISRLAPNSYVLDLGCGPARASAAMRDRGLRVDPVDASPEMVRLANETYDIGARLADFTAVSGHGHYDGVWANFSLLHASRDDFPGHLERLHRAMTAKGILHIAMKLGAGSDRDKLGRSYTYYSRDKLPDHLTATGFSDFEFAVGESVGLAGNVDPWIAITAVSQPAKP